MRWQQQTEAHFRVRIGSSSPQPYLSPGASFWSKWRADEGKKTGIKIINIDPNIKLPNFKVNRAGGWKVEPEPGNNI